LQSRTVCFLLAALVAGCGGGSAPKSDAEAVRRVLRDAAKAVADGDGDKACGYLTPDAQRQAALQFGAGALGQIDCPALVERGTAFLTPLDRDQIEDAEPQNIQILGSNASGEITAPAVTEQGGRFRLNLQKTDDGWKISGFAG
jgi:hypothetical protein